MRRWISAATTTFISSALWVTSALGAEAEVRNNAPTICIYNADAETVIPDELRASIERSRRDDAKARFERLVQNWREERRPESWVADMVACPSYQRIMSMGAVALPLIFQQMEFEGNEPDHWFWALRSITEADPVPEADRGNIVKMASAWLEWGRLQGYAW